VVRALVMVLSGLVLGLGLACHRGPIARPALTVACAPDRIGKVSIHGGTARDVPQLAVLEGTLDAPARTRRIAAVAVDQLRARGYAHARVSVERREGCGVELVVAVQRGRRYRITEIAFATDDEFPPAARLAAVEDALGTVNAVGGAYVEARLTRALTALRHRYHAAGWLDATIDTPRPIFDERRGEVTLTIPIRAGLRRVVRPRPASARGLPAQVGIGGTR
jgi:outer membrane protein assembly factor BamA